MDDLTLLMFSHIHSKKLRNSALIVALMQLHMTIDIELDVCGFAISYSPYDYFI